MQRNAFHCCTKDSEDAGHFNFPLESTFDEKLVDKIQESLFYFSSFICLSNKHRNQFDNAAIKSWQKHVFTEAKYYMTYHDNREKY